MALHPASPLSRVVQDAAIETLRLHDDGAFPNNPRLPVIVYRGAFRRSRTSDAVTVIERVFGINRWSRAWHDGLYGYHHYHSNAHEALGCFAGDARIQIGGPTGPEIELATFDVLVLPAGVAHKTVQSSEDFCVVGCYAGGRSYDMKYGHADERPEADERIAQVPVPEADPVYGRDGPLVRYWRSDERLESSTRSTTRLKRWP